MKTWFDALADKRSMFFQDFLPETNSAELIAYRVGAENTAAALIARFPLPAGTDPEQIAKDYYTQYSSVRFLRATPLPEGSPEATRASLRDRPPRWRAWTGRCCRDFPRS